MASFCYSLLLIDRSVQQH